MESLPLAFWVCKDEELPENILDILNILSKHKSYELYIDETKELPGRTIPSG